MIEISSSQFPSCCGVGFISRPQLFRMLAFGEEIETTDDMIRGQLMEPTIVRAVEAELGYVFECTGDDQRSHAVEFGDMRLIATPDGRRGNEGLEVKAPRTLSGEPPRKYLPQLAGQMLIHGFDSVLYAELAETLAVWRVYRCEALESAVVAAVECFSGFVRSGSAPPRFSWRANPKPKLVTPLWERLI